MDESFDAFGYVEQVGRDLETGPESPDLEVELRQ